MTNEINRHGLIVKAQSGFFTVETGEGLVICQLRGKLKRGRAVGDIAALGDHVQITVLEDGSGVIENVEERKQALVRLARNDQTVGPRDGSRRGEIDFALRFRAAVTAYAMTLKNRCDLRPEGIVAAAHGRHGSREEQQRRADSSQQRVHARSP